MAPRDVLAEASIDISGTWLLQGRPVRGQTPEILILVFLNASQLQALPEEVFLLLWKGPIQRRDLIKRTIRLLMTTYLLGQIIAGDRGRSLAYREPEIDHSLDLADRLLEKTQRKLPAPSLVPGFPEQQPQSPRPPLQTMLINRLSKSDRPGRPLRGPSLH